MASTTTQPRATKASAKSSTTSTSTHVLDKELQYQLFSRWAKRNMSKPFVREELNIGYKEGKLNFGLDLSLMLSNSMIAEQIRVNKTKDFEGTKVHFLYLYVHLNAEDPSSYIRIPVGIYFASKQLPTEELANILVFPSNHTLFTEAFFQRNPQLYRIAEVRAQYANKELNIAPKFQEVYEQGVEYICNTYFSYLTKVFQELNWLPRAQDYEYHSTNSYRYYCVMDDLNLIGSLRYSLMREHDLTPDQVAKIVDLIAAIAEHGTTDMTEIGKIFKISFTHSKTPFYGLHHVVKPLLKATDSSASDEEKLRSVAPFINKINDALIACWLTKRAEIDKKLNQPLHPVYGDTSKQNSKQKSKAKAKETKTQSKSKEKASATNTPTYKELSGDDAFFTFCGDVLESRDYVYTQVPAMRTEERETDFSNLPNVMAEVDESERQACFDEQSLDNQRFRKSALIDKDEQTEVTNQESN